MRWKPNASEKAEYKKKCEERNSLPIHTPSQAIRKGCYVEYYSFSKGMVIKGMVINSSYGVGKPNNNCNSPMFGICEKGQHTFTIQTEEEKVMVKGRNLYPNILKHIPGKISNEEK